MRLTRALTVLLLVLVATVAHARVGGGQGFSTGGSRGGFSGGGGSFSGGGGGGSIDLGPLLWWMFEHPWITLALLVVFGVAHLLMPKSPGNARGPQWTVEGQPTVRALPARSGRPAARAGWRTIQREDPMFSEVVFLDLAQLVVRRAWEAVGTQAWGPLAPYLRAELHDTLTQSVGSGVSVEDVVLASLTVEGARVSGAWHEVDIKLTASRTLRSASRTQREYVEEQWTLRRAASAHSLPPEAAHRLGCPSCGSAAACDTMGRCRSCGTPVTEGQLQWQLIAWVSLVRRPLLRPEVELSAGGDEPGWSVPSVLDPDLAREGRAFRGRHPHHDDGVMQARLRNVFESLQAAWDAGRWSDARPFTTDAAWHTLRFWLDLYARTGLRNRVEDVRWLGAEVVRISVDACYEQLTVRIRASCLDYMEDAATGRVVGGSPDHPRRFSEYWTFVRAVGSPGPSSTSGCPSCGAPLDRIEATGACSSCGTVITLGTHDWVLSRIEQPEVYAP